MSRPQTKEEIDEVFKELGSPRELRKKLYEDRDYDF